MGLYYIASEENVNYLAHHGVKGMKWGSRKNRTAYAFAERRGLSKMGFGESFKNPIWRLKTTRDAEIKKEYIKRGGKAKDYEKVRADSMRREGKGRFIAGTAMGAAGLTTAGIGYLLNKKGKISNETALNLAKAGGTLAGSGAVYGTTGAVMNRVGNNSLKKLGALNDKKKRK